MSTVLAVASPLPSALNAMPTAVVVGVLCIAVIVEIVAMPTVLPGATITLLAGALIGAGRPVLAVAVPLAVAVVGGDQLAYFTGTAVSNWWGRRRPGRPARRVRGGPVESWFAAALPALAGASGLRYRQFAVRVLALRLPWLAAALAAGALAAQSIGRIGHVMGIAGLPVTGCVLVVLLLARRRAGAARRAAPGTGGDL
jgi:membrane protein DedA with SNARE-associated domain